MTRTRIALVLALVSLACATQRPVRWDELDAPLAEAPRAVHPRSMCLATVSFDAALEEVPGERPPSKLRLLDEENPSWSTPNLTAHRVEPNVAFYRRDPEHVDGLWGIDEQERLVIQWTTGFQSVTFLSEVPFAFSPELVTFTVTEYGDILGYRDVGRATFAMVPCS